MEQQAKKTVTIKEGAAEYRAVLHENASSLELEVTLSPSGDLYANSWDDSTFNPATVFAQLEAKKFTASFPKGECVVIMEGGAKLKLPLGKTLDPTERLLRELRFNEEERKWRRVGTINDYDALLAKYPFAEWKWGGTYNNLNPMALSILNWNRGVRVTFKHFYPQGDNGGALILGNAVWTRGTDDDETKNCKNADGSPGFYHRYVNADFTPRGSNGLGGLAIWVKRR